MARVFIDGHMFGVEWFKQALTEMLRSDNVVFIFGRHEKLDGEIGRVRDALAFYKMAGQLKTKTGARRRDDVNAEEFGTRIDHLVASPAYNSCAACDDPHIFALVWLRNTPFVFSCDLRLAVCRNHLRKSVDNRYCNFRVIANVQVYGDHRHAILAP